MFEQVDRTQVMGIVNITPDSFSDGGRFFSVESAVSHAHELLAHGADIIDVGGESTRPGAQRVSAEEELRRVIPVVTQLAAENVSVSVDTMRAEVAEAAVAAGAVLINDVSGGLADSDMYRVIAETQAACCLMHWKTDRFGDATGAAHPSGDVVAEVKAALSALIDAAVSHNIAPSQICVDPGLGFAKTAENNWALLQGVAEFDDLGVPLLIGASRKRFLTQLGPNVDAATAAVTAIVAAHGVWGVRVHDVALSKAAVDVAARIRQGQ